MTTTTCSVGSVDGDIGNAANWDNGLPDATVDAVIDLSAAAGSLSADVTCKSLSFIAGALHGVTSNNHIFQLHGDADFTNSGTAWSNTTNKLNLTFNAPGSLTGAGDGVRALYELDTFGTGAKCTLTHNLACANLLNFGTSTFDLAGKNVTTTGNMTVHGALANASAATITVGGNFTAVSATLAGGTFVVTGTAVATSSTIGACDFSGGTALTAINACTDALGNSGVLFFTSIVNVVTTKTIGSYQSGESIPILVAMTLPTTVTGTPRLRVQNFSATGFRYVNYASGSGTKTLTFTMTAAATDVMNALRLDGADALELHGGTMTDASAGDAHLGVPVIPDSNALHADVGVSNATVLQTQLFPMPIGLA